MRKSFAESLNEGFEDFLTLQDVMEAAEKITGGENHKEFRWELPSPLVEGKEYKVMFDKYSLSLGRYGYIYEDEAQREPVYIWSVNFYGPRSTSLTHAGIPNTVYANLMLGMAAFIWKEKPKGFTFHGATDKMDLQYDNYHQKWLTDAPGKPAEHVYYRLDKTQYIRKDVAEGLPPESKRKVFAAKEAWDTKGHEQFIKAKKQSAFKDKYIMQAMRKYHGKFFKTQEGYLSLGFFLDRKAKTMYLAQFDNYTGMRTTYEGVYRFGSAEDVERTWGNPIELHELKRLPQEQLEKMLASLFRPGDSSAQRVLDNLKSEDVRTLKAVYDRAMIGAMLRGMETSKSAPSILQQLGRTPKV